MRLIWSRLSAALPIALLCSTVHLLGVDGQTVATDSRTDINVSVLQPVVDEAHHHHLQLTHKADTTLRLDTDTLRMTFVQAKLHAGADVPIELVMTNFSQYDRHNVILLDLGTDVDAFGEALSSYVTAPDAWDNAYIPPDMRDVVLGHTPILAPDETATVSLPGLPAGEYTYLCTVPGHWKVMQGMLIVQDSGP